MFEPRSFPSDAEYRRQMTASVPRTFAAQLAAYRDGADFPCTLQAVDQRLHKCSSLIATARDKARYAETAKMGPILAVLDELSEDRRALASLRDDLLTGASDREAAYTPPGRRTASGPDDLSGIWYGDKELTNREAEEHSAEIDKDNRVPRAGFERYRGKGPNPHELKGPGPYDSEGNTREGHRWVELESAKFLAENADVAKDYAELGERARRYAATETSALSRTHSASLVDAFEQRVYERARALPQPRTASVTPMFTDFHDGALFL